MFSFSASPHSQQEISLEEFSSHLSQQEQIAEEDRQLIFQTAMKIYSEGHRMSSPTMDLFIRDALAYSVQQAKQGLSDACRAQENQLVAWGNTNLAPAMYRDALQQAFETNRAIRFIKWSSSTSSSELNFVRGQELPAVSLTELQSRNITRFLRTGRSVNSTRVCGDVSHCLSP
jgi:hypothetical protein